MTVLSIQRDWGPNVSIVRMITNSSVQDVGLTGWLAIPVIQESIIAVNNGPFEWKVGDVVLIDFVDPITGNFFAGAQFYTIFPDFQSLNPMAPIYPNLQNIVAHPGGGQTDATQLNIGIDVITVVATAGDSVKLPTDVAGQSVIVYNAGANAAAIFPSPGDTINGGAPNASILLPAKSLMAFYGVSSSSWVSETPVNPQSQVTTGLVAHAGGGQANATQANIGINVVTTVATQQDSVKLPSTVLGQAVIVSNKGANALALYPATGGTINELAANTPISIFPDESYILYGTSATNWVAINTSNPVYGYNPGIVANPGGNFPNAPILQPGLNIVSTVATAGDSIRIPSASLGESFYVRNSGANALVIWPFSGGAFYGHAPDTTIIINAGISKLFLVSEPLFIDTVF